MAEAPAPYVRPTPLQRELLEALVRTGSVDAAAHHMRMTARRAYNQLAAARRRSGVVSTEQLIYLGVRDGWISPVSIPTQSALTG